MKIFTFVRHGIDFLLLTLIIALGLGGLVYFRFDTAAQIAVVVLMTLGYVFWGILHHLHDGNLTGKVVMEYIAMAALISFILIVFLLRA